MKRIKWIKSQKQRQNENSDTFLNVASAIKRVLIWSIPCEQLLSLWAEGVVFWRPPCFLPRYSLPLLLGDFRALGMLPWRYYRENSVTSCHLGTALRSHTAGWFQHPHGLFLTVSSDDSTEPDLHFTSSGFRKENFMLSDGLWL